MKRLFYLTAGAALGAYATRRISRAARACTPGGLAETAVDRAAGAGASVRDLTARVRSEAAVREDELREILAGESAPREPRAGGGTSRPGGS